MRSDRGISVLALAVTVIVMLIITSITAYNGIAVIKDARIKDATDKLSIISSSLRKDDSFLGITSGEAVLTQQDYISLDLEEFYDEDYPVLLEKSYTLEPTKEITKYVLKMFDGDELIELYAKSEFLIEKPLEKNTYGISFDETKGVNRPILLDGMYAIRPDMSGLVQDIYTETWYNYNPAAPSFAKMKCDSDGDGTTDDESQVYIWIPRYAYSIQEFYNGMNNPLKPFTEVPSTAMKIVFLREDTNYMVNDEVLPSGYRVHPAFKMGDKEHAGIWVAMDTSTSSATFASAVDKAENAIGSIEGVSSHLMTSTEYAAALYLMFAYDSFDQVNFRAQNEFVAAGNIGNTTLKNLKYADLYSVDNGADTGVTERYGDALTETNWDRLLATFPKASATIVVRLLKSGYFDFNSVSASSSYYYRPVIVME